MGLRFVIMQFVIFSTISVYSQINEEEVLGYYLAPEQTSIFKFCKKGDNYYAKIVWLKRPERIDSMNPDINKQKLKLIGSIPVYGLKFDGIATWTNGFIYDANSGRTYRSIIIRDEHQNLLVRGYYGISFIGKTKYFVKIDYKE